MTGYAAVKAWRERNPDEWRRRRRAYDKKNKDAIKKTNRIWRANNRDKVNASVSRGRSKRLTMLNEYKASRGCVLCGNKDYRCLEFHHRDPGAKEFNVSSGLADGHGMDRMFREMDKCDVICANCHRILHHTDG